MQKQTSLIFALLLIVLSAAPVHVSRADANLNMANITKALQAEYQTQLKKSRPRHKARKSARRSQAERDILADYQRLINQSNASKNSRKGGGTRAVAPRSTPKPAARPVAEKPPIPDADELFDAANRGDVNTIARLLRDGVNVNAANHQKETALHMAAARGHYSTVIYLIKNGANPFARTVKQWLPIHHATRFRHANIARYLMQRGLSPRFRTSDGYSAIDMARTNNDRQLLSIFGAR